MPLSGHEDTCSVALETAPGLGRGHGPLGHGHTVYVDNLIDVW